MEDARALLADLVAIDSINPSLVPGGAGEGEIARFVGGWLSERGLEVDIADVEPGRPNVVARARGKAAAARCSCTLTWMSLGSTEWPTPSRRGSRETASTAAVRTT